MNAASAQDSSLFKNAQFKHGNIVLNYRILYPVDYDVNKKYPVVFFLHGLGERGSDNEAQLKHGSKLFLDSANRAMYSSFVIFPQCPIEDYWAKMRNVENKNDSAGDVEFVPSSSIQMALEMVGKLVDSFSRTPQVNVKKIYVGGLSMGAMGTFELLWRKPEIFAAAIAICGAGDPEKVALYAKGFPIWVFHGTDDKVVTVNNSRVMVNALKKAGAEVKYTEYPGVSHDSWDNAFAEPELLKWLFEQEFHAKARS